MPLDNVRTQYAVGQGYFQAGELLTDKVTCLRYVVDCGAMTKYADRRDASIDAYLAKVGAGQLLDILFISHAHADHLNGIERLLDKSKGVLVNTIVLPLLGVEDRLIAYARAASEDATSADNSFYRAFALDPASALGRFDPDRIIFVEPGSRDGGAPFSGGPDDLGDGGDDHQPLRGNKSQPWRIVGRGKMRQEIKASPGLKAGTTLMMPDTLGLLVASADPAIAWLLSPFVDPSVKSGTALFIAALAAARRQTVAALKKWLRLAGNLEKLLTVHVSDLKAAYAAVNADLNITSMCLYSGPVPTVKPPASQYVGKFGKWTVSGPGKSGVAWLGTGDAALANKKRRNAFFKHYRSLLEDVVTLTLPHHGSENNFDETLLDRIQPSFCVASADQFGNWRHPGTAVVQSVASTGRFLAVVTANADSEVREFVRME